MIRWCGIDPTWASHVVVTQQILGVSEEVKHFADEGTETQLDCD